MIEAGVGNLRPVYTFDVARARIFASHVGAEHHDKAKHQDKQIVR